MAFKPRVYADLVFETVNAEAVNISTLETLAKTGIFYARIIGSNSKRFCTDFVDKVYYTGVGPDPLGLYPNLSVLPNGGAPFHVRCTKRYVAYIPRLASPTDQAESLPDARSTALHGK